MSSESSSRQRSSSIHRSRQQEENMSLREEKQKERASKERQWESERSSRESQKGRAKSEDFSERGGSKHSQQRGESKEVRAEKGKRRREGQEKTRGAPRHGGRRRKYHAGKREERENSAFRDERGRKKEESSTAHFFRRKRGEGGDLKRPTGKLRTKFDPEALEALEWERILEYLASLCRTSWGIQKAKKLPFLDSYRKIEWELEQTREALHLFEETAETLPVEGVEDLSAAFQRLEKGGILEGADFLEIANELRVVEKLHRFLSQHQEAAPHLWERGELLEPLKPLRKEIERIIGENGQLKDDASWELESLREAVRKAHERIRRKLQQYLTGPMSQSLTDTYYTLREDRYVLPVKASEKRRFEGGIVYGSSATGQTIYIEPQSLVELNNALRIAENDVAQEELRLLRELSHRVKGHLRELIANLEIVRDLDLVQAKVRLIGEMRASIPEIVAFDDPTGFDLRQFRHPLLILKGVHVVPNDLQLGGKQRTLVISGPNTGGKTVALKMLGLAALMARAALPIPAERGSRVPLIDTLFTDIGDRQSIEEDLSTFSAQILKLHTILDEADPKTLVLIDEIVVGTDPEQGSSLAAAILLELAERGAFVAVTTHYEALKMLPYEDERFVNASVGFDLQRLEPTYRLFMGTPGTSNAIQIARRLGMPEAVLDRVQKILGDRSGKFDRIISKLEQQYEELFEERERETRARRRVEKQFLRLEKQQSELDALKQKILRQEGELLNKELREARQQLKSLMKELKEEEATDLKKIHQAHRTLQETREQAKELFEQVQQEFRPQKTLPPNNLKVGQKVKIPSLNLMGEVLVAPDNNGFVKVQVGHLKMQLHLSELGLMSTPSKVATTTKSTSAPKSSKGTSESPRKAPIIVQTRENTCDLRGLTIEEALDMTENFLDQAFRQEWGAVFLIHGHGTGALRKAIRHYLKSSPYAKDFRAGEQSEGGNGVTVVQIASF